MKSTTKNNTETELSQENANQHTNNEWNSNNNQLIEREKIKDTPFTIVKHNDEWYITMGKYRLSEGHLLKETAWENAKLMTWNRIMQVIGIMIDEYKK